MRLTVHPLGAGRTASDVVLTRSQFVASGGEASVYAVGYTAFKVWTDRAAAPDPGRLLWLAGLGSQRAPVVPDAVLKDGAQIVGCRMPFAKGCEPLTRFFNSGFRSREGVDDAGALRILEDLRDSVQLLHTAGATVVDLQPANVLVEMGSLQVRLIDSTSWQLPGFAATAVLDTIRDRHATRFGPESDWFSFAVVAFQLLVGVHPYRGSHPTLKDLDARMLAHCSAFDSAVSLPPNARSPRALEPKWRDWLHSVLEDGERTRPPGGSVTWAAASVTLDAKEVRTKLLFRAGAPITMAVEKQGRLVVCTTTHVHYAKQALPIASVRALAWTADGHPVAAWVAEGRLHLWDLAENRSVDVGVAADALMPSSERVVVMVDGRLVGVEVRRLAGSKASRLVALPRELGSVMPKATTLFDGVAVQDVLGNTVLTLLEGSASHTYRLDGITARSVVAARYSHGLLAVVVACGQEFKRIVVRFSRDRRSTEVRERTSDDASLDMMVVGGKMLLEQADGQLQLSSSRPGDARLRGIEDPWLAQPGFWFELSGQVGRVVGDEVHRVQLA